MGAQAEKSRAGGHLLLWQLGKGEEIQGKQKVNVILVKEEIKCACSLLLVLFIVDFSLITEFQLS